MPAPRRHLGTSFTLIPDPAARWPPPISLPTFEGKLAAFLVYVYGGPTSITYTDGKTYSGLQDMTAAHTGLGITVDQYDYFIANIVVPALDEQRRSHGDVTSCFAPVVTSTSFVASIVGHRAPGDDPREPTVCRASHGRVWEPSGSS